MNTLSAIPEQQHQRALRQLLADPSVVRTTTIGKRIQFLSPGRINVHEGPDFLDMAILLDSTVIVGHGEFHRKTSDWLAHNHSQDLRYQQLAVHIVCKVDVDLPEATPTVVISEDELIAIAKNLPASQFADTTIEDVHTYSLLRLLRMTAECREFLKAKTLGQTLSESLKSFIIRFEKKNRRPVYPKERLEHLYIAISTSVHARFLMNIQEYAQNGVPVGVIRTISEQLHSLLDTPIFDEGAHLRREVIVNCILPIALAIADDQSRITIFEWYWSTNALNEYGILKRTFPEFPQVYLWQQQGMLEMLREKNARTSAHEAIKSYGLMHTIAFYKSALEAPEIQE